MVANQMRRVILAIIILCLVTLACAAALTTPGDYLNEYGGDVNIYTRILAMTDCTDLQRELEHADANLKLVTPGTEEYRVATGYKTAAENRIREVECSGDL